MWCVPEGRQTINVRFLQHSVSSLDGLELGSVHLAWMVSRDRNDINVLNVIRARMHAHMSDLDPLGPEYIIVHIMIGTLFALNNSV